MCEPTFLTLSMDSGVDDMPAMISEPVVLDAKLVARSFGGEWSAPHTTIRWSLGEGDTVRFTLDSESRSRHQIVRLVWTEQKHGRRARFICPKTGLSCNRLFLMDGELASVKGHGLDYRGTMVRQARAAKTLNRLLGADGRRRPRGVYRQHLLQKASVQISGLDVAWVTLASASIGLEPLIKDKPKARTKPALSYSMALGLRNGHDRFSAAGCSSMLGQQLRNANEFWVAACEALAPHCGALDVLEDQPQLDFGAALRDQLVVQGAVRPFAICWPDSSDLVFVGAFDLRDPERAALHLRSYSNGYEQTIRIASRSATPRSRRAFLCPVTGERAEQLYWRENRFASRQGQRLIHRSRRSSRRSIRTTEGSPF